jgi:hypothetical protein
MAKVEPVGYKLLFLSKTYVTSNCNKQSLNLLAITSKCNSLQWNQHTFPTLGSKLYSLNYQLYKVTNILQIWFHAALCWDWDLSQACGYTIISWSAGGVDELQSGRVPISWSAGGVDELQSGRVPLGIVTKGLMSCDTLTMVSRENNFGISSGDVEAG